MPAITMNKVAPKLNAKKSVREIKSLRQAERNKGRNLNYCCPRVCCKHATR